MQFSRKSYVSTYLSYLSLKFFLFRIFLSKVIFCTKMLLLPENKTDLDLVTHVPWQISSTSKYLSRFLKLEKHTIPFPQNHNSVLVFGYLFSFTQNVWQLATNYTLQISIVKTSLNLFSVRIFVQILFRALQNFQHIFKTREKILLNHKNYRNYVSCILN